MQRTYLESLANTENNTQATINSRLDLTSNELIALLQNHPPLTVTNESPVDLGILELVDADLTGERAIGLVEDILGRDADVLVGELAGEREVEGGRGDDDLGGGIELGGVEVANDGLDALDGAVPVVLLLEGKYRGVWVWNVGWRGIAGHW